MKGLKSILSLSGINLLIIFSGILSSILNAKYYGVSRQIECFFSASLLSRLILSFTQTGQIVEFVIPRFIKLKTEEKFEDGNKLFSGVLNNQILFGILLTAICCIFAKQIIDVLVPGFSDNDKLLTTHIFFILLPTIIINLIIGVLTSFLNAGGIYGRNEMIQFFGGLISIGLLVALYRSMGIMALVFATLISQCFALGAEVFLLFTKTKMRYRFVLFNDIFSIKDFFSIFKLTIYYASSLQILNFAINAALSFLPQGIYAVYRY